MKQWGHTYNFMSRGIRMIKFSEQQLKVPKLMRPVYLVTAGQSKFDRAMPDKRTEEFCVDAFTRHRNSSICPLRS